MCELLEVSYQTTVLCALRPAWKLEPCLLSVFKVRYRLRQINFLRFLGSLPATLRCLWNSSILFNKFSFEEHVLILKCFSWVEWFFPWGGIPGNSWRGCATRFSKFSYHRFISYSIGTNWQICPYTTVDPSKTIPDSRPKWAKPIPVFIQAKTTQTLYPLGRHIPIS